MVLYWNYILVFLMIQEARTNVLFITGSVQSYSVNLVIIVKQDGGEGSQDVSSHELGITRTETLTGVGVLVNKENCFQTRRGYATQAGKNLENLRRTFDSVGIDAYIISTEDFHQRSGASPHNKRLFAVSGFSGDIGTAVITKTEALLWTDGRLFNTAIKETECDWILHRKGGHNVPSLTKWLKDYFKGRQNVTVGASSYYISSVWWRNFEMILSDAGIGFKDVYPEIVDKIWLSNRPTETFTDIDVLTNKFAGKSWQEKLKDIHVSMKEANTDILILAGLDENAWLFNMRATDTRFDPYFYSFSLIDSSKNTTRLYIGRHLDQLSRIPVNPESNITIADHLNTGSDGSCRNKAGLCVEVMEYDTQQFVSEIRQRAADSHVSKVWVSPNINYAILSSIPKQKVYQHITPAMAQKAQKNSAEREGMRKANLRDSVAVIRLYARIEKDIKDGKNWTVASAAQESIKMRRGLDYYQEPSFGYLSGSGPTGAHIYNTDFMPNLTTTEIFLQDSGGQYLDGTTDVTRTFHYGTPSLHEKKLYTHVLMSHISLAMHRFPKGHTGHDIDDVARAPIWELGMDYPHETGHGVSAYGAVNEGPARISSVEGAYVSDVHMDRNIFDNDTDPILLYRLPDPSLYPLVEHMCFSDEPGIYEEGKFGVRIENVFMTRKFNNGTPEFLEFETLTLVPYEPHLILYDLLSPGQIQWMNDYHAKVWKQVGPLLNQTGDTLAYQWLKKRVQAVTVRPSTGHHVV